MRSFKSREVPLADGRRGRQRDPKQDRNSALAGWKVVRVGTQGGIVGKI